MAPREGTWRAGRLLKKNVLILTKKNENITNKENYIRNLSYISYSIQKTHQCCLQSNLAVL